MLTTIVLLVLSSELKFTGSYFPYRNIYNFGPSQGSTRVILHRLLRRRKVEKILKNGRLYFRLTTQGVEELKARFLPPAPARWDKKWRILIVDRKKSRAVEARLIKLGFGIIQKSVYISPYECTDREVLAQNFFFEAKNLSADSKSLASLIWKLPVIRKDYMDWIEKTKYFTGSKAAAAGLLSQYEHILQQDPRLPRELVPADWPTHYAFEILLRLVKRYFSPVDRD